jgi:hypothetical protein
MSSPVKNEFSCEKFGSKTNSLKFPWSKRKIDFVLTRLLYSRLNSAMRNNHLGR